MKDAKIASVRSGVTNIGQATNAVLKLGALVGALLAMAVPLGARADWAYQTGSGHGYVRGEAGTGVVADMGKVSAFCTGSRDGYASCLRMALIPNGVLILLR